MADIFNWLPDDKPSGKFDHRLREVRFGDGYRQIAPDGMNAREQSWPLSFDRDEVTVGLIAAFIDNHLGEWFLWTPPGSNAVQGKYICSGYTKTPYSGNNERLSCTFEEFFAP